MCLLLPTILAYIGYEDGGLYLTWIQGQNGNGQNGTDKMVWTKWYMDKMALDKMARTKWYGENGTEKIVPIKSSINLPIQLPLMTIVSFVNPTSTLTLFVFLYVFITYL